MHFEKIHMGNSVLGAGIALSLTFAPLITLAQTNDADFWKGYLFETELTAAEETHDATPALATGHAGAWFAGEGVDFNYWLSVFSEEPVIGAHFHCAPSGSDGPVVLSLDNKNPGGDGPFYGEIGRGYIADDDIATSGADCAATIGYPIATVADLARAMKEGVIYANIHTPSYPAGAARGQLTLFESPSASSVRGNRPERPERPERPARPER